MENKCLQWIVSAVKKETADTITIFFDTRGREFCFRPGQFINLTLPVGGSKVTRSYSLSSVPGYKYPAITVKRVPGGIMSGYLLERAGELPEVEVEGPFGNFVVADEHRDKEIVFLAGGSGITPIYSMMAALINNGDRIPSLIYANGSAENMIFRSTIEKWRDDGRARVAYAISDSASVGGTENAGIVTGRLSRLVVKKIVGQFLPRPEEAVYFICGPQKLMELYAEALAALQVPPGQIISESFNLDPSVTAQNVLPEETHEVVIHCFESATSYQDAGLEDQVQVTSLVRVAPGQSVLDAAVANGLTVKHSCRNGTCGSCYGRHTSGDVRMVNNFALTPEEVDAGYVLLCQSYPYDSNVTIELG